MIDCLTTSDRPRIGPSTPKLVRTSCFLMAVLTVLAACDTQLDTQGPRPVDPVLMFGMYGESAGQFIYPRAMDVDPDAEVLYIIDRSGRIQLFSFDGQPLATWWMPKYDNGYPTGITRAPDGRVFVADTHEYCVTIFDSDGNLLEQVGEFGSGPGQFHNPSDIEFGPNGRIYVAEFGEHQRIQVFDADFNYLFEFGSSGAEPGQFNRPQSMAFDHQTNRLYVCDACNHRLQVFDPDGKLLQIIGSIGTEPGEFRYPYSVKLIEGGSILVSEFGNNRLQVLSADGEPMQVLGRPGTGRGEFHSPWTAIAAGNRIFVLDSRNNRVQVIEQ